MYFFRPAIFFAFSGMLLLTRITSGQQLPGPPAGPPWTPPPASSPIPEFIGPPPVADPSLNSYLPDGFPPPQESLWSPAAWLRPVEWDRSVELGINASEGNAEAFSVRAGGDMKRKTDLNEISLNLTYAKASANDIETQHNALLNAGYEQTLGQSRWTLFDKVGLEYDEFRAFDIRFWLNTGIGYQIVDTETLDWKGRFGAGASREFGGPADEWIPEAVFGTDYEHQLNARQKLSATIDYFPAWDNFADYRLVGVVGWEVLLSEEHDLSLKVSVNDRYDSTPNGRRPNDVNYAVLLLWNL